MVQLTVNGQTVEVPEGSTVLDAAAKAGVEIPRLCHHPALKPFGACRVCLVEVQGMRTLQPSCTLPAAPNMVVQTDTKAVNDARKFVLSLIFSERNHFCPYCQMTGGDCELQNAALDQGMTHWPIMPSWKVFPVDASHPQILVDHNRCILCRRCVRICADLVGMSTLGFEERGSQSMLTADLGSPLGDSSCISCGACVQVCPTGTLTNRLSNYQGRNYTAEPVDTVCLGCGIGCGITAWVRDNRIIRIDGDWQAEVNGGILCRTGRFDAMDTPDRITSPQIRKDGKLVDCSWEEALVALKNGLAGAEVNLALAEDLSLEAIHTARQVAAALSGNVTLLPQEVVEPVPPHLGEHVTARTAQKNVLSKLPPAEVTWAEAYAVQSGANGPWLHSKGTPAYAPNGKAMLAVTGQSCVCGVQPPAGFKAVIASQRSKLTESADVLLPCASWSEQSGHYLNLTGQVREAKQLINPAEGIRSTNAVLAEVAQAFNVSLDQNWQTALQIAA